MKEKRSTFEIIRSIFNLIAVAAYIITWVYPGGRLGVVAFWVFLLLGFLPIDTILSRHGDDIEAAAGELAPAFHLGSIFLVGIFFRNTAEPLAYYLVAVFIIIEVYLKRHYEQKCTDYEKRFEALKAKEEKQNEST